MTDEILIKAKYILDSMGVSWAIGASTLLGMYRDDKLIEGDDEVDMFILDRDIDVVRKSPFFRHQENCVSDKGLIYFDIPEVMTLSPIIVYGDNEILNPTERNFLIYPKGTLLPFSRFDFHNITWNVPHIPVKHFACYYNHWEREEKDWKWINANNLVCAQSIEDAIKKN